MTPSSCAQDDDAGDCPSGFRRVAGLCGPFIEAAGPLYGRVDEQKGLLLGFRVQRQHTNPLDCAHGGMLASLADMLLAAGAMYRAEGWGRVLPTVSLQLDFLAPARRGSWVLGRMEVLKATGTLIFAQGLIEADGALALRASAVLRRGENGARNEDWDPLRLRST